MASNQFQSSWWLFGGHAQTLWPVLMRRVAVRVRTQRLELPDGDFVRLEWVGPESPGSPIVIVLPGLQGDVESSYVRRMLRACEARGWRAVLLNYRGRGELNRRMPSYHCGMTCDLDYLAGLLHQREPQAPLGVVGYSLGANIALKWLGENGQHGRKLPVTAAAMVSAPFQLGVVARHIENGFSRLYQWYLLGSLRRDVKRKMAAGFNGLGLTDRELAQLNTFFKFDDRITGPLNGFDGALDYYEKTRTDRLLRHIQTPTLILNSRNDPLIPPRLIPAPGDLSDQVQLEITESGGHMGFVCGRWPWSSRYWADTRVPEFLAESFSHR